MFAVGPDSYLPFLVGGGDLGHVVIKRLFLVICYLVASLIVVE